MKNQVNFKEKFAVASTQFGGVLGAGVASGATVALYFVQKGGYCAAAASIIALLILFAIYFIGMETAREYKLENHTQLYNLFYGNSVLKKVLTPLANITVFYMMILSSAMAFAGAGTIVSQYTSMSPIIGGLIVGALCILVVFFGLEIFKKLQSWMCLAMFLILSVCYIVTLVNGGAENLKTVVTSHWMPETASVGKMLWWALSFIGLYVGFLPILLMSGKKLTTPRDIGGMLGIGFVLNASAFILPTFAILAYSPAASLESIPAAYVVNLSGIPHFTEIYLILLFLALISTGASCLVTIGAQLSPYLPQKIESERTRNSIIYIVFAVVFALFAPLGMANTLKLLAPVANYLCIFSLVLPIVIFAPVKLLQKRNKNPKV